MVCVSICQGGTPDGAQADYEHGAAPAVKALRFDGLLQSQMQHSRMVQSLYRQSRAQQPNSENQGEPLAPDGSADASPSSSIRAYGTGSLGRRDSRQDHLLNSAASWGMLMTSTGRDTTPERSWDL